VIGVVVENLLEFNVNNSSQDSSVIDLQSTDFELFQLPAKAQIDLVVLSARWRELQSATHPDRFASMGQSAVRIAMQYSARINEAYQRLKVAQTRFAYLCEINGVPIQAESNTSMPLEFLNQQMIWREALEDSNSVQDLEVLQEEVTALKVKLESDCLNSIDFENDYKSASQIVRSMMFVNRFQGDIDKKIDRLEQD
jgi:molecular chaperone HscB